MEVFGEGCDGHRDSEFIGLESCLRWLCGLVG